MKEGIGYLPKKLLTRVVLSRPAANFFALFRRHHVPIFMMHRMRDDSCGVNGHDPDYLRWALTYLRDNGYQFISLLDLVDALASGAELPLKSVVFTMDDGFLEQVTVAAPIFEEFGCPVSIFLLGNFSSGKAWPWDYQLKYLMSETRASHLTLINHVIALDADTSNSVRRLAVMRDVRARLKSVHTTDAINTVQELAVLAGVTLGDQPPASQQPIHWELARRCESEYVTFGPHSMNHSLLAHQSEQNAEAEITESWDRVKNELGNALPVFCYPTGRKSIDFGEREMALVKKHGFKAALSANPGYVGVGKARKPNELFALPRFSFPDQKDDLIKISSGLELLRSRFL